MKDDGGKIMVVWTRIVIMEKVQKKWIKEMLWALQLVCTLYGTFSLYFHMVISFDLLGSNLSTIFPEILLDQTIHSFIHPFIPQIINECLTLVPSSIDMTGKKTDKFLFLTLHSG